MCVFSLFDINVSSHGLRSPDGHQKRNTDDLIIRWSLLYYTS